MTDFGWIVLGIVAVVTVLVLLPFQEKVEEWDQRRHQND